MRLAVEPVGFADAAHACRSGNLVAAMLTDRLSGRLQGYAGMAGDDSTSAEFADVYDGAAAEAMSTLRELTHAFAGLGQLLDASGNNHHRAEAASAGLSDYTPGSLPLDDFVEVNPSTPPSTLGATPADLGTIDQWILDRIEGFVWPGADVQRLREAATTWQRAADTVADLADHCEQASRLLEDQHSPEVPLARDALDELRTLVLESSAALIAVSRSCEEYADAVQDTHDRTRALLTEIGKMIVEGVVISGIAGLLSGGVGAGAAGTAALARIAAQAPRFHAFLVTLKYGISAARSSLRTAQTELTAVSERASRFARARWGARNERGSIGVPGPRRQQDALTRVRNTFRHPASFDPDDLRGLDAEHLGEVLKDWRVSPARSGSGTRFEDPEHFGRQIRIMEGYPGNRPDPVTHGPYAVISQNGNPPIKIPLKGNPTL